MHRKKQAQPGAPIGTWSIDNGVLSIMGITIRDAIAMAPSARDLHVVELWAGVASIVGAATLQNYASVAFDLNRCPGVTDVPGEESEDITTLEGFKKAMTLVLRLCEGGLLALGPDCSSFTFPNSSRHKRKAGDEVGDLLYQPVNVGNLMAVIALFLCQLALARRVHFALENPPDSHMFRFFERVCPTFMNMVVIDGVEVSGRPALHSQSVARCPYDDGPEPKLHKAYKWLATWSGIRGLNARCKCSQGHRKLGHTTSDGIWSGNLPLLAESAAYPKRLGQALLSSWMRAGSPISATWSNQALELTWVDPRSDRVYMAVPEPKKCAGVSRSQEATSMGLGPWSDFLDTQHSITRDTESTKNVKESDSSVSRAWGPSSSVSRASNSRTATATRFGPWGDCSDTPQKTTKGSVSTGRVEESMGRDTDAASLQLGPWSSASSSAKPSTPKVSIPTTNSSASASASSLGPWGGIASASPTTSLVGFWGPWKSAASASSETGSDAEAEPGQIGSPE